MTDLREQIAKTIEPTLALNDPLIIARERANRMSYQILALFSQWLEEQGAVTVVQNDDPDSPHYHKPLRLEVKE